MFFGVAYAWRLATGIYLLCSAFVATASVIVGGETAALEHDTAYETKNQHVLLDFRPQNPFTQPPQVETASNMPHFSPTVVTNALQELHTALETMQSEYFSLWLGKWTSAIDWTAAVMGTHVTATLSSLSHSLPYTLPGTFDKSRKLDVEAQMIENEINKYFSQSIAYYFGEDFFSIRTQAYDDMLWVVLGWLDSIHFIRSHSKHHYPPSNAWSSGESDWHAQQFTPPFAHRARVFYELAEKGWDWKLCGGGMTWNPRLLPYKNAITNELFISASIRMYLHFPGDNNCSPFMRMEDEARPHQERHGRGGAIECEQKSSGSPYEPIYLANAINGYDWLKNSGMTNKQGLYVDGFHIKDYAKNHSKTECDDRNEMVYTYNQGVVLSGLRGLWEGTGNLTYLEDGHELVRNVIRATGWTDTDIAPATSFASAHNRPHEAKPSPEAPDSGVQGSWSGLGSHGILTELCDPSGSCSQNGHTFKGIFFHHLTAFCTPLPASAVTPGKTHGASEIVAALHRRSCNEYTPWVVHNAQAALKTRDGKGRFGMWWGAGLQEDAYLQRGDSVHQDLVPEGGVDYENVPKLLDEPPFADLDMASTELYMEEKEDIHASRDLNDRGRGRTVETQGGGVAVVRAMWEFLRQYGDDV